MKKCKILLLIIFAFVLTGCSVDYNVEIYKNDVKVNGTLLEENSDRWYEKVYDITYQEMVDLKTTGDEYSPVIDGLYKIDEEGKLGLGLKNKYKLDKSYISSPGISSCYKYFRVMEEDNKIILSSSLENLCFDEYKNLDNITINLKTNHKVVSSNADTVNGYHYTWNISRENKDDAAIQITLEKDKYIFNYENEFVKKIFYILIIVGIILGVGSITYIHFKKKNNNLNEI